MALSMLRSPLWFAFFILLASSALAQTHFYFDWPTSTTQCDVVTLAWRQATPPLTAFFIPIYGQPFIYKIPDSSWNGTNGSYDIQIQLGSGSNYVLFLSDGSGFGAGGSSEIQQIGQSVNTACLNTAAQNQTSLDFTFTLSGQAEQCQRGFEMSWSGGQEYGPYNFTVIPLDQGFYPFEVPLEKGKSSMSSWQMNMTAGSRFTIMMNSGQGYGRGGTAGVYQVANSTEDDCISTSLIGPTGSWPAGLATMTLPVSTLPITEPAGLNKGLSGGAIAGTVIGVIAALAILLLALWFLLRRRKARRAQEAKKIDSNQLDLADGGGRGYDDPQFMVEPYRPIGSFEPHSADSGISNGQAGVGHHERDGSGSGTGTGTGTFTGNSSSDFDDFDGGSRQHLTASAGFAGAGVSTRESDGNSHEWEDSRPSGPGYAGPLPLKATRPFAPQPNSPRYPPTSTNTSTLKSDLLFSSSIGSVPNTNNTSGNTGNGIGNVVADRGADRGSGGGMRIVNHDDPTSLPALPPGARYDDRHDPHGRERERRRREGPTFRRHEDAGRIPVNRPPPREEEIVDLPPLYTDVPRDGPDEQQPYQQPGQPGQPEQYDQLDQPGQSGRLGTH